MISRYCAYLARCKAFRYDGIDRGVNWGIAVAIAIILLLGNCTLSPAAELIPPKVVSSTSQPDTNGNKRVPT